MDLLQKFCDEHNASLNIRYVNGQWQAQLAKNDGTFSATAFDPDFQEMVDELVDVLP